MYQNVKNLNTTLFQTFSTWHPNTSCPYCLILTQYHQVPTIHPVYWPSITNTKQFRPSTKMIWRLYMRHETQIYDSAQDTHEDKAYQNAFYCTCDLRFKFITHRRIHMKTGHSEMFFIVVYAAKNLTNLPLFCALELRVEKRAWVNSGPLFLCQ